MRILRTLYQWLPRFRRGAGLATAEQRRRQATVFLLCGFYCLIAIAMLGYFGVQALLAGNEGYGRVLLGFAGVTGVCYVLIWLSGALFLANHMVTLLMGLLCLYLFQSGGVAGTGPLWYFVFPPLALFLQDIALLLKQEVRYVDQLSRWDADEFGVLLPQTSLVGAVGQAERIRLSVTRLVLKSASGREPLTLSAGVGQFRGTHASRFVHEVREQLAFAVSTGGNCVMYADL